MIEVTRSEVRLPDGQVSALFRVSADGGIAFLVAELGATLMRIEAPDRHGARGDVILGSDDLLRYPMAGGAGQDARLGATCGRVANRIAGASFVLDGNAHKLDGNEGDNQLHGGSGGFGSRLWKGRSTENGVELMLTSHDGDQGYPGTLSASARFELIDRRELRILYTARTDRPTHVNIVSHPYFNLSGDHAATIGDHHLEIGADRFLPIDATALPFGRAELVAGTPFDFRHPRSIGEVIDADHSQLHVADGFNHCFVLRPPHSGGEVRFAARLCSPLSGRTLTLETDQPALHVYSGNALGATPSDMQFERRAGICLEAQAFPNAANRPDFPTTRLDPGETYRSELRLLFGVNA